MTDEAADLIALLQQNISRVVLGKADAVRLAVVALLAGEHVLLEDVPGVGKTLMGKAIARSLAGHFHRIQFTPDLLPADITGSSLYNGQTQEFIFSPGPIFANVVLADEINRATPRTQSALLESMSERQVSADGQTLSAAPAVHGHRHAEPRRVRGDVSLARKPTRPLPAPHSAGLSRAGGGIAGACHPPRGRAGRFAWRRRSIASRLPRCRRRSGRWRSKIRSTGYMLDIIQATRRCDELHVGVSTRGALALYRAAQAAALVAGRQYVVPDDVKRLAVPVLAHRVIPKGYLHGGQREAVESLVERLVEDVPVPG